MHGTWLCSSACWTPSRPANRAGSPRAKRRSRPMNSHGKVLAGIMGGTLLSASAFPPWADVLHTAMLAAVGATVSFLTAWLLQHIVRRRRR
ncbi:hypothetical protein ACFOET_19750 [Parapedobacter deserti]|uniref:Uncharacterized protein n=1 Tax=Parapedobacter deserti TaxID=1912957 RepID=A0ABV7JP81_9SPHI